MTMRAATLLFYAVATLSLGVVSATVGPLLFAQLASDTSLVGPLTTLWIVVTIVLALLFLVLFALEVAGMYGRPDSE